MRSTKVAFRLSARLILTVLAAMAISLLSGCPLFSSIPRAVAIPSDRRIMISEVMSANKTALADFQGDFPDWFEIRNLGGASVDLSGWAVSDSRTEPEKWRFPARTLAPGAYLVVFASGKDVADPARQLHTNFTLGAGGDDLFLSEGGTLEDYVEFGACPEDRSWNRAQDGTLALTDNPTPGAANLAGAFDVSFSLPAGLYSARNYPGGISITLGGTGTIRYTTDGSEPTASSTAWSGTPIAIALPASGALPGGKVISARLWNGASVGPIIRNTYILHNGELDDDTKLGIVSVAGDPAWFLESPASESDPSAWLRTNDPSKLSLFHPDNLTPSNGIDIEYPVNVEFFDENRAVGLEQKAGITLFGSYSRTVDVKQKSFELHARNAYGKGKFEYDFFGVRNSEGGAIDSFDNIILRDSGNDWASTMLRDDIMTSLVEGLGPLHQAYRPVALYVNGAYMGFYSLRDKVQEQLIYARYPSLSGKPLDFVYNIDTALAGNNAEFQSLVSYAFTQDMSQAAKYDYVAARIDVGNFIDYQIANIWFGNTDWPANNMKAWRTRTGGIWRWIVYDTDFGMGLITHYSHNTLLHLLDRVDLSYNGADNEYASRLFYGLMQNQTFSTRFYLRLSELMDSNFSHAAVSSRIDEYAAQARDEIKHRHLNKFGAYIFTADATLAAKGVTWENQIQTLHSFADNRNAALATYASQLSDTTNPIRNGVGSGLTGSYYNGTTFSGAAATVNNDNPNFSRDSTTAPASGVSPTSYSVEWNGYLKSAFNGTVGFVVSADTDCDVFFDQNTDGTAADSERIVRDRSPDWKANEDYGYVNNLVAGTTYKIRIRYTNLSGASSLVLRWAKGMFSEVIPLAQFSATP